LALTNGTETTISTRLLSRIIVGLIAVWSALAGLVLVGFEGAASGALGVGILDRAGQRLIGVHLLVLVPVYLLIALRPDRYRGLLWLPLAAQLAASLTISYNILAGDTDVEDGLLAVAVGAIFVCLLGFVWVTEQRAAARQRMEADLGADEQEQPGRGPNGYQAT